MFHIWHIAAIVLVFFLGVIVGKELFWRRTSKQAMKFMMHDLSDKLKRAQVRFAD